KASVVNEGRIQTAEGGYAALMAGNVSNQARLAGAGVGLSWEGPRYWRASFSVSQPIGNAPSQLSGSSYLHANAWLELSKGFR
ncbi:MAG: hypothetical protein RLZZ566_1184, partial [Pseudomonadota bacterium]